MVIILVLKLPSLQLCLSKLRLFTGVNFYDCKLRPSNFYSIGPRSWVQQKKKWKIKNRCRLEAVAASSSPSVVT